MQQQRHCQCLLTIDLLDNIDYGSIKSLIKDQTTPGKGKAISVPGHAATIADEFEDQLLLVIHEEHERVSRFVKSKWYEVNSRLGMSCLNWKSKFHPGTLTHVMIGSIERQLNQVQRRKDGLQHMRDTVAVRRKAARIESDILKYASLCLNTNPPVLLLTDSSVGEEIQHLCRFIASNRLAIRKLLKKYRKWTGLTTLASKVESKILTQSGSFTKLRLDYALDLYTAYLEAVRSPFKKLLPRQLSAVDLAQRSNTVQGPTSQSLNSLFDGSDLDFDLALAAEVQGDKSQSATYWVHKDNAVELRILLLQYMRGAHRRTSSTGSKNTVRRGSAEETPATAGAVLLDNFARVSCDNKVHESSIPAESFYAAANARWNAEGQAIFSLNTPSQGTNSVSTYPGPVRLPRERLAKFLNVDSTYQLKEGIEGGQEDPLQIQENAQRADAARSWLRQHKDIKPLIYMRLKRGRFVGLENQPDQAAWAAVDEEVDLGEVALSDLQAPAFFTNAPQQGLRFPHAVLTVRTEGDCSNLLGALNESHLVSGVKRIMFSAMY